MAKYTVMGCTGARELSFKKLKTAVTKARSCARSGKVPINVRRHTKSTFAAGGSSSVIVYRCTSKGCGGYSPSASSYKSWERQAKADSYLKGSKRRCPANVGSKKAPKALKTVRR